MTTIALMKRMTMPIDQLWRELKAAVGGDAQTRVDAAHPLDIYADVQPPYRVGLVAVCSARPPEVRPMRAISVEVAKRSDGRWTLRLSLLETQLLPVFAALCRDIIACTRCDVDEAQLGRVVVQRLIHWRTLLERDGAGLDEATLRGLIGELLVLRDRLLPVLHPSQAVGAWRGPFGSPQDFVLPNRERIEVKTVGPHADQLTIHGLAQLDGVGDPLSLIVVRGEIAPADAPGALTAAGLIANLRSLLLPEPEAFAAFETALNGVGWHEHPSHSTIAIRLLSMDQHTVGSAFPQLTRGTVPAGVLEADYLIRLPNRTTASEKRAT